MNTEKNKEKWVEKIRQTVKKKVIKNMFFLENMI